MRHGNQVLANTKNCPPPGSLSINVILLSSSAADGGQPQADAFSAKYALSLFLSITSLTEH